jgi:hypothetical protein
VHRVGIFTAMYEHFMSTMLEHGRLTTLQVSTTNHGVVLLFTLLSPTETDSVSRRALVRPYSVHKHKPLLVWRQDLYVIVHVELYCFIMREG